MQVNLIQKNNNGINFKGCLKLIHPNGKYTITTKPEKIELLDSFQARYYSGTEKMSYNYFEHVVELTRVIFGNTCRIVNEAPAEVVKAINKAIASSDDTIIECGRELKTLKQLVETEDDLKNFAPNNTIQIKKQQAMERSKLLPDIRDFYATIANMEK